ncbi:MAG: amidohydrolase family protein, partial [Deltaproteobacteria bacterium]|nr:amidohydrolase family protein [Deltaproteobacteria bacterium]
MFDYFIRNGFVIDGISPEPLRKNIGISGDKISYLGKEDHKAHKILDVEGLFVTPGFIDVHGHSEFNILLDGRAEGKLLQGITTEINGNCGFSAAPLYGEAFKRRDEELQYLGIQERWHDLKGYFKILLSKKIGLNFVTLCGHSNLRGSVIGYDDKPADGRALQKMKALYHHSLKSGACGFSTGLVYPPGMYSDTKEIVEILKNPMDRSVIYTSHIRSESENLLEAIEEIIKVGKETSVKVHISHLKTSERQNWSKIDKVIQLLESAREEGIGITADSYPYIASSTDLD